MAEKHAEKMNKRSVKSKVLLLIIFMLIGVLGFSVYQFLSEYIPQQREQQHFSDLRDLIGEDVYEDVGDDVSDPSAPGASTGDTVKVLKQSKYDQLFGRYDDMCGWIRIDDTPIDYPVMKSDLEDGEYYLHRDVDGDYSFAGCLFIGNNCNDDSDIFIVYGHNMNNGSMFGTLTDFGYADFVRTHRDIYYDTKDERRVYRIFASFEAMTYNADDKTSFKYYANVGDLDSQTYYDTLNQYRSLSWVWMDEAPEYPKQIMLLSTCYTDKERFVVAAYRVK